MGSTSCWDSQRMPAGLRPLARRLSDAGYETVINLAPTSVFEKSVIEEDRILSELKISYVHIPVDFKHPTDADFDRFVESVEDPQRGKLWVHCAANMRVSAFVYRYRVSVLGEDPAVAGADLEKIWAPFGVWKAFVGQAD